MTDEDRPVSASMLNYRAAAALDGDLVVDGTSGIVDALTELLRSPHHITREVRDRLAAAFDRGRGGYRPNNNSEQHLVRLVVEDFGPNAGLFKAIVVRRNWMDAGEEFVKLRDEGTGKDAAMVAAGSKYSLSYESMRKSVLPFYDAFAAEFADDRSDLHEAVRELGYVREDDEDYYFCFRSHFIDRAAQIAAGVRVHE